MPGCVDVCVCACALTAVQGRTNCCIATIPKYEEDFLQSPLEYQQTEEEEQGERGRESSRWQQRG